MTTAHQPNLNLFLDYTTFITRMREVVSGATLIQALYKVSDEEWARSTDLDTGTHLIQGVFTSAQKSDAIRIYISKLINVHMISQGGHLTAWTKDTIASENATNVAISNRIAATEFRTNEELFMLIAGRLMGYDETLLRFSLSTDVVKRAQLLVNYLSGQFDLSVQGTPAHEMYFDQVRVMSELLQEGGFTPEFYTAHIYHASKHFEVFTGPVSNHWDTFELLQPIVEVNAEHRVAHNVSQGLVSDGRQLVQPLELEFRDTNIEKTPLIKPVLEAAQAGEKPMALDFNDGIDVK
jgi:hypothetical protein